jgi:hypothetical protein
MKHPGYYELDKRCSTCGAHPTVRHSTLCDHHWHERLARLSPIALRSAQVRRERYPHMHIPSGADLAIRTAAHRAVNRAVLYGDLPKLDGSIKCFDCDAPARHYDHRDYRKQLAVQPVCASCNRKRGTAIWSDKAA